MEQIGEGGMGLVFVAEQQQPVRRRVALKIIKPGMDSRQVIARFEAERQALALMDHANIATIYDGGTTPDGRPYFVMELVKGTPITDYCDQHCLTPRQRLELFGEVCQAVQHAHQKGIIHRDLKPSNVLVSLHDVTPVVKVIDFGVAKAIGGRLTDKTVYTAFAQMVGTPQYMSPEQAGLSDIDVDTRSDVYALGVLLYELLTGTTPFESATLKQAGYDEMRRMIREVEPPRPSTRLSTIEQAELSTIAERRGLESRRLSQQLRGELDWIVMKALEKDRNRRYESASALAADVQRYLTDEPVLACPPSAVYRLRKFARRNKRLLTSVMAIAASLLMGLSVTVVLLITHAVEMQKEHDRTKKEYDRAETAFRQAQGNLERADQNLELALRALDVVYMNDVEGRIQKARGITEAERKTLEKGLQFYEQFAQQNAGHEKLQRATAKAYRRAGFLRVKLNIWQTENWTEAKSDFAKAIAAFEKWADESHGSVEDQSELARSYYGMARALRAEGQYGAAASICRRAIALWEKLSADKQLPNHRHELGLCLMELGQILSKDRQPDKAAAPLREGLRLFESLAAEYPKEPFSRPKVGSSQHELGDTLRTVMPTPIDYAEEIGHAARHLWFILPWDRIHEKLALLQKAVDVFGRLSAEHPDDTYYRHFEADTRRTLGDVLSTLKRYEEAEKAYRQAMDLFQKLPGIKLRSGGYRRISEEVLGYTALANFFMARNRSEEAATVLHQAIALYEQFPNDPDSQLALSHVRGRLVGLLQQIGQHKEAAKHFQEAAKTYRRLLELQPADAGVNNKIAWFLATCADAKSRDPGLAVELANKATELVPKEGMYWNTLGVAHYRAGNWKAAIAALQRSIELRKGGDSFDWFFLAMAHWQGNDKEKARAWYDRAVAWMDKNSPQNEELKRFRAEATALLGLAKAAQAQNKKD